MELERVGAFNIFLGANNAGKTSVLEAIFLLTGMSNPQLPVMISNHRNYIVNTFDNLSYLFHSLDTDTPIELSASLSDPEETRELVISAADTGSSAKIAVQHVRDGNDTTGPRGNGNVTKSSDFSRIQDCLVYNGTIKKHGLSDPISFETGLKVVAGDIQNLHPYVDEQSIINAQIVRPGVEYDGNVIADVIVHKKDDELLKILRDIDPSIQGITVRGNVAYLDVGFESMMPLNMFGGGMVRAVSMISSCIVGNTKILLIDEIENGLHYKAILPLLKALLVLSAKRGIQIFSTAHSIEVLQGLQEVLLDPDFAEMRSTTMCHVLARDKQDLLRAYRYDYLQFDHCIENGIEIR